ncbi:MAG: pilus assembly protein [Acidimicrobiales bacterium]
MASAVGPDPGEIGRDDSTTVGEVPTQWRKRPRPRVDRRDGSAGDPPTGRGERGATLVESAIITPVLMLFVFAIFEFGFAFRDYLTVANVTRDGAREASVAGNVGNADYRTLRAMQRAAAALARRRADLMVIFEAAGPNSNVPSTCKAGTAVIGVCNVYTSSSFASTTPSSAVWNPRPT